ncbi:MAG: hypothetical protein ACK4NH_02445 [Gemmobacter sp.]
MTRHIIETFPLTPQTIASTVPAAEVFFTRLFSIRRAEAERAPAISLFAVRHRSRRHLFH